MGLSMAAKRRHWKEKNGRYWARVSIPSALRAQFDGKTQLTEALGGDLRAADLKHAAAVSRLQAQIANAARSLEAHMPENPLMSHSRPSTAFDHETAVWAHYENCLKADAQKRASMPTPKEIADAFEHTLLRIDAGDADPYHHPVGMFNVATDYEMKAGARHFDQQNRSKRLSAMQKAVAAGDTRFVDAAIQEFFKAHNILVEPGSPEWRDLGHKLTRAEIDALKRTLERDEGLFSDAPTDPIVKPVTLPPKALAPISLMGLFRAYIVSRQALGKHKDGAKSWESVIRGLIKFLGHDNAARITKRNLLDWRDSLMASGRSPKTISDKHLAAVRAVLKWAFENDRLPSNEAESVRQEVPRKVRTREKGYTTSEAVKVLKASLNHEPAKTCNPANRESKHLTAAKRWVPLLCAFTGARVTEMTQLRKEDLRREGDRWVVRISPDAGSVKSGQYRDVPLHRQLISLGFTDFVNASEEGPLFHSATTADKYLSGARGTSGKLSEWLNRCELVPAGVQPSHGWRHRFKTQGRELGASDRVLDAIQGHTGRTASDSYGDVTIVAKLKIIDMLPEYHLGD